MLSAFNKRFQDNFAIEMCFIVITIINKEKISLSLYLYMY